VTVKGTIFSVTQNPDALVVEVAEGTVAVNGRSGEHLVQHGERLHLSAVGIAQGSLDGARENALRAAVGVPSVVGFEALPEGEARAPESPGVVAAQPRPAIASRGRVAHASVAPEKDVAAPEAPPVAEVSPEPAITLPEKTTARAETAADWLTQAEQARKAGKFAEARTLYRRVAEQSSGTTAEAAWVALARMELSLGHPAAARDATKRRQERFGHGTLEPEALWIDVRTYRQSGDVPRARALAEELVRRWPKSPQARAAEQWLSSGE
jgi:tetratricopeptide (TPR) repeat protein